MVFAEDQRGIIQHIPAELTAKRHFGHKQAVCIGVRRGVCLIGGGRLLQAVGLHGARIDKGNVMQGGIRQSGIRHTGKR